MRRSSLLFTGIVLVLGCSGKEPGRLDAGGDAAAGGSAGTEGSGGESGGTGPGGAQSTATGGGGGTAPSSGGKSGSGGSKATGGGTSTGGSVVAPSIVIQVSPSTTTVIAGRTATLSAAVRGGMAGTPAFTWSVVEGPSCGTIDATGTYTAPASVPSPEFCHVSVSAQGISSVATITVVQAPPTNQVGVWENVTPNGVSLNPGSPKDNFGVQDVLVDPVRQSDVYVFVCYQGVWKSTDYGLTYRKVNTGRLGALLETGRPWSAAIDNNPARDPNTPPALYTTAGTGAELGVFKSVDGGVNWTKYYAGADVYSYDMDPYDNQHLITGMHESVGLAESTDGGQNWTFIPSGSVGTSIYPFFIDTGDPATTRRTWLLVPQMGSGTAAMTFDGGRTISPTTGSSGEFAHPHGGNQLFNAAPNVAYVGASGGVWRTQDGGKSWHKLYKDTDYQYQSSVIGTAKTLYAWADGANSGGIGDAKFYSAPRDPGTPWTAMATPPAMNNGPKRASITFDGAHHIIIGGNWNAGFWRYVEP